MKKAVLPLAVFLVVFVLAYLCLCYLPGNRIAFASEGDNLAYFWQTIRTNALRKCFLCVPLGLVGAGVVLLGRKWKKPKKSK